MISIADDQLPDSDTQNLFLLISIEKDMKDSIAARRMVMNSLRQNSIMVIWLEVPHRMRQTLKTMRLITCGLMLLAIFNFLGMAMTSGLNNLEN